LKKFCHRLRACAVRHFLKDNRQILDDAEAGRFFAHLFRKMRRDYLDVRFYLLGKGNNRRVGHGGFSTREGALLLESPLKGAGISFVQDRSIWLRNR
jgi:hypothetical protein